MLQLRVEHTGKQLDNGDELLPRRQLNSGEPRIGSPILIAGEPAGRRIRHRPILRSILDATTVQMARFSPQVLRADCLWPMRSAPASPAATRYLRRRDGTRR